MQAFRDSFTQEQKAVIISTLIIISNADGNNSTNEEKKEIAGTAAILGLSMSDPLVSTTLFYKLPKRIEILNTLENNNKEWFAISLNDFLKRVPRLSMTKIQYVMGVLNDIGISETRFIQIADNADKLKKLYIQ
jgi:hypothetical protein